jgi:regulatory protein
MPEADDLLGIEAAAIGALALREHSRFELSGKLARRFPDAEGLIAQVLDDLQRRRLLSDRRFVEQYVGSRTRKGFGPLRIRQELQQRGIDSELIEDWLEPADADWAERLHDVARQRFGDAPAASRKEQAKRARFLLQRGYPESMVRRYLWD